MSEQTYKYKVEMTCEGCVNAVKRCLQKAFGDDLKSVDTDLTTKSVSIVLNTSSKSFTNEEVFNALKKCGKEVSQMD